MADQREPQAPRLESDRPQRSPTGAVNFGSKGAFIALFSQIGITLLVANLGGALLGRWVDGALNSNPIFLIVGFIGGFAVGAVGAAQLIKRALKQFELSDTADREARLARRRAESEREE